jgi:NitT/TauT family transport system substrate-binding protein
MKIRLMENFRAAFYAPYYATHALGFYEREGVDVELMTSDAPGDAVPKLIDGAIDLTWGGPMRVMKAHDQDSSSPLVSFCEVVSRDPFYLIGRSGAKPFTLADLPHLRFASVSEVPTPWQCLQHDLRELGIDPDRLPRIADRTMARNYDALRAGEIDVMQAFEPFVTMAERDRAGDILHTASARGPTVYTAFIATRDAAARHRDAFAAIVRATRACCNGFTRIPPRTWPPRPRRSFRTCRPTSWRVRCAAICGPGSMRAKPKCPVPVSTGWRRACIPADSSGGCRATRIASRQT